MRFALSWIMRWLSVRDRNGRLDGLGGVLRGLRCGSWLSDWLGWSSQPRLQITRRLPRR